MKNNLILFYQTSVGATILQHLAAEALQLYCTVAVIQQWL